MQGNGVGGEAGVSSEREKRCPENKESEKSAEQNWGQDSRGLSIIK